MANQAHTYPLGAVCKLTGLSEHTGQGLGAAPRRGFTRCARAAARAAIGTRMWLGLRLLAAAVNSGFQIGEVAALDDNELRQRSSALTRQSQAPVAAALAALEQLDLVEVERLFALQLAALGPARFARGFALPLLEAVGDGYQTNRLCIASEHMASTMLRSLLGAALRPNAFSGGRRSHLVRNPIRRTPRARHSDCGTDRAGRGRTPDFPGRRAARRRAQERRRADTRTRDRTRG